MRDAGDLPVEELAREVRRLAEGARERTLGVDELRGQTFTVSNIGAVGAGWARRSSRTAPPPSCVGRAGPRPVVRNDRLEIVRQFPLSLSYDHRIIDGAEGRRFMAAVIAALEG